MLSKTISRWASPDVFFLAAWLLTDVTVFYGSVSVCHGASISTIGHRVSPAISVLFMS